MHIDLPFLGGNTVTKLLSYTVGASLSVIDTFERWLRDSGKSPHTIKAYTKDVARFFDFVGKPPEEISGIDISNWYAHMREVSYGNRGPRKSRREKGYNNRSLARFGWALRKFFQAYGRPEVVPQIPTPSYEVEDPRWLTQKIVFNIIQNSIGKARSILSAGYDWALRVREVTLIKKEWFEGDEVTIYRLKRKGAPRKTKIPVSPWCEKIIKSYIQNPKYWVGLNEDRLFPLGQQTISYYWRKSAKRAGINPYKYTFQSLRHSRITQRAIEMIEDEGKVDEVRLAMFAGHLRTSTTLLYTHLATKYLMRRKKLH